MILSLYSKKDDRYVWEADGATLKHCKVIAKLMAEYLRAEFIVTDQLGEVVAKSDNTNTHRMNWVMS